MKYYILLLKSKWKRDFNSAIKYANKVISTTTTILGELARFELISLYVKNNQFELAKKECKYLRDKFNNISEYARNLMIPGLKLLNTKYNILDKEFKSYSDNYVQNNVVKAILKYSQARDYIKKEDYNKAYELFIEGYYSAKKFPHPTMICNGLNGAAWWMRNEDKKKALVAAELLEYYIGYYFEDLMYIYNWLDTVFEVRRINNDVKAFDTANTIIQLNKDGRIKIKKTFYNFIPEVSATDYKIDNELKNFILKYNDLKIRKGIIKSKTIMKFINSYNIKYTSRKLYAIRNEYYKIYKKKLFGISVEKFEKLNEGKIIKLFFATYTVLKIKISKIMIKNSILRLNKNKLINFFSMDYEKMHFFNIMLSDFSEKNLINNLNNNLPYSTEGMSSSDGCLFFIARKKLITELLKNMKNFKEFILHYFDLSDEEMKIFDVFLRNCVRYDIKWPITPYPKGKIRDFAIKYGLGQKRIALGYYSFEDDENFLIDEIIDKFL
ncbi:hypothetical protein XO12_10760 [Marinitoga sp. 1154]|uniref:hypothetical protein n=1 Tax=Marinitoga sp. 1154 TaxID=1643335 RepID=UPI0020CA307F|nr:hypothetical protein [Marinitoga sp. 1154]NUV00539.1 hypothetical protein [Marinitoga sp. 1154]